MEILNEDEGNNMKNIMENIVQRVIGIQDIIVSQVKAKRGSSFKLDDWLPLIESKKKYEVLNGESKEIINLFKKSAEANFETIKSLTDTIRPEDEPWIENFQAPPILGILYELDPKFKKAIEKFIKKLDRSDRIVERMVFLRYSGIQGSRSPHSFFPDLYKPILDRLDFPDMYKETMEMAVTCSRNTSYTNLIGDSFAEIFEGGGTWVEGVKAEKRTLMKMWSNPTEAHIETLHKLGFSSFDPQAYLEDFKSRMIESVKECVESGVHYGNILMTVNTAGAIEHHIGQMTYNFCKDDVVMAIFESVTEVLKKTLLHALEEGKLRDPFWIPIPAITGVAAAYLLRQECFTAKMVTDLLMQRSRRMYQHEPRRLLREDLNPAFLSWITKGEQLLEENGGKVRDIQVDLSPIEENEVLNNPSRYTWGQTPITLKFSALMRFADEPYMLISDPAFITWWVDVIALKPKDLFSKILRYP